ncbi:hypothetical protein C3L33_00875, partial [Rhododendron williamsianum]
MSKWWVCVARGWECHGRGLVCVFGMVWLCVLEMVWSILWNGLVCGLVWVIEVDVSPIIELGLKLVNLVSAATEVSLVSAAAFEIKAFGLTSYSDALDDSFVSATAIDYEEHDENEETIGALDCAANQEGLHPCGTIVRRKVSPQGMECLRLNSHLPDLVISELICIGPTHLMVDQAFSQRLFDFAMLVGGGFGEISSREYAIGSHAYVDPLIGLTDRASTFDYAKSLKPFSLLKIETLLCSLSQIRPLFAAGRPTTSS